MVLRHFYVGHPRQSPGAREAVHRSLPDYDAVSLWRVTCPRGSAVPGAGLDPLVRRRMDPDNGNTDRGHRPAIFIGEESQARSRDLSDPRAGR